MAYSVAYTLVCGIYSIHLSEFGLVRETSAFQGKGLQQIGLINFMLNETLPGSGSRNLVILIVAIYSRILSSLQF